MNMTLWLSDPGSHNRPKTPPAEFRHSVHPSPATVGRNSGQFVCFRSRRRAPAGIVGLAGNCEKEAYEISNLNQGEEAALLRIPIVSGAFWHRSARTRTGVLRPQ